MLSHELVYVSGAAIQASGLASRSFFFCQAEDGIRDLVRSRGLGDVYKRQGTWRLQRGPVVAGIRAIR